jgi:hypothetical protein
MSSKPTALATLAICLAAHPPLAWAEANDACSLLTAAEVSAALGTTVGAGQPITPTDHKACTWKATDGNSWVTVMLQAPTAFESGKRSADASKSTAFTSASGLGEDAYYVTMDDEVGLIVKTGQSVFKIAVHQPSPLWSKRASERILAEKALPRL